MEHYISDDPAVPMDHPMWYTTQPGDLPGLEERKVHWLELFICFMLRINP